MDDHPRSSSERERVAKKRRILHGLNPNKILTPPSSNTSDATGEQPAKRMSLDSDKSSEAPELRTKPTMTANTTQLIRFTKDAGRLTNVDLQPTK